MFQNAGLRGPPATLLGPAPCKVELKTRNDGKPAGFAIATFESVEAATKAVTELNDSELEGRKIIVRFSRPEAKK